MGIIRLYRFKPKSQPPATMGLMNAWFKNELNDSGIEPISTFNYDSTGPINLKPKDKTLAEKIYRGIMTLRKAYKDFINRL